MFTAIVKSEEELDAACVKAAANGLRLAAISNAGLPPWEYRATFLPESAFMKPGETPPPAKIPRPVQEWIDEKTGRAATTSPRSET